MILILIFAEALDLYDLIVALILIQISSVGFPTNLDYVCDKQLFEGLSLSGFMNVTTNFVDYVSALPVDYVSALLHVVANSSASNHTGYSKGKGGKGGKDMKTKSPTVSFTAGKG